MTHTAHICAAIVFLCALSWQQAAAQTDTLAALELRARTGTLSSVEWARLAHARRDASNTSGALDAAKKAVQADPRSDDAKVCLATMLAANRECGEAREQMKSLIEDVKPSAAFFLVQADIALACDSADAALIPLLRAREMAPDHPLVVRFLGDVYARMGVNELAIRYYTESLTHNPGDAGIHERLAECHLKEQKYGDAASEYEKAIQLDSNSMQSVLMLGKLMFAAKRYDRSATLLSRYLTAQPGAKEIRSIQLDALVLSGQFEEAKQQALRCLEKDAADPHARKIAARASYQLTQYSEARAHLQRLDETGSLDCEQMLVLARCERALKLDSVSILTYRRVVSCDSGNALAISELGSLLMRSRRYDEAMATYTYQATVDTTSAAPLVNLALSAMALGRWYEAETYLRNAIARKPDHVQAHVHLGRCMIETDSLQSAMQEFATAIALYDSTSGKNRDDVAEAQSLTGWLHMQQNRSSDALRSFDKSLALRSNHVTTLLWKAQTLTTAGKKAEAAATFKAVLAIDPSNVDAKRGLQMK